MNTYLTSSVYNIKTRNSKLPPKGLQTIRELNRLCVLRETVIALMMDYYYNTQFLNISPVNDFGRNSVVVLYNCFQSTQAKLKAML